jgi:hypothetical protein
MPSTFNGPPPVFPPFPPTGWLSFSLHDKENKQTMKSIEDRTFIINVEEILIIITRIILRILIDAKFSQFF